MNEELRLGPIGQIAREVSDIAAAVAWYRDVLGLPFLYQYGDLAFFDCGGTRLFISPPEGGRAPAAQSILYFRVGDIAATQVALEAKGVHFYGQPHMIFKHESGVEEWLSPFNDNEGRPLCLISQVAPPETA